MTSSDRLAAEFDRLLDEIAQLRRQVEDLHAVPPRRRSRLRARVAGFMKHAGRGQR